VTDLPDDSLRDPAEPDMRRARSRSGGWSPALTRSTAIRGYASEFSGKVSGFADSWEVTEAATTISMPDERAYAISGVDGGIAVLRGNTIVSINQSGTWRTRVELLTIEGKERWRADVDWPVRQPVIDGGGGRVYVAGDRLAALDHGDTVWEVLGGRVRATAFSDGAVAFTQGSTLQIRTRDGQEVAKLETPDRAELVTPPAIASDGSIWVASESEIYVARWPR